MTHFITGHLLIPSVEPTIALGSHAAIRPRLSTGTRPPSRLHGRRSRLVMRSDVGPRPRDRPVVRRLDGPAQEPESPPFRPRPNFPTGGAICVTSVVRLSSFSWFPGFVLTSQTLALHPAAR
jgi:hypothetical protein